MNACHQVSRMSGKAEDDHCLPCRYNLPCEELLHTYVNPRIRTLPPPSTIMRVGFYIIVVCGYAVVRFRCAHRHSTLAGGVYRCFETGLSTLCYCLEVHKYGKPTLWATSRGNLVTRMTSKSGDRQAMIIYPRKYNWSKRQYRENRPPVHSLKNLAYAAVLLSGNKKIIGEYIPSHQLLPVRMERLVYSSCAREGWSYPSCHRTPHECVHYLDTF
jgi:hypothetical protein